MSCGEPDAQQWASPVRRAGRGNGPAVTPAPRPGPTQPLIDVGDARLLGRERQPQPIAQQLGRLLFEGLCLGFGAAHQHHEIVRVADHPVAGVAVGPVTRTLIAAMRAPRLLEVTVEHREGNVRQQGRQNRALRRAR